MPLIKQILTDEIQKFADKLHPLFEGFPNGIDDNAEKWANAIDTYARVVLPVSVGSVPGKEAFIKVMKQLSPPLEVDPNPLPFTLYYKSPEYRMRIFNIYLRDVVKYKSNPSLDRTVVFTVLSNIREEYNKLKPILAFSKDDIVYNQRRFNEIYAKEILSGKIIPLRADGVTTNSTDPRYRDIPVDPTGKIIALQEDGIIGDDTIRYLPTIESNLYTLLNDRKFITKYRTLKFVTQPKTSGEVDVSIPKITSDTFIENLGYTTISALVSKRDYIDKGLMKDYTQIVLDKSQSDLDGGSFTVPQPVVFFITEYERRHSLYDNFWINNGRIKTIKQLQAFIKLKATTYNAKPKNQKDGVAALEDAITAYAQLLAIGMNPTFTGAPSVNPIDLSPVSVKGLAGASNAECISLMVNIIDTYFKSGTATNNSSGASTTWS